ncbi:MAG: hypothetical protein HUJ93_08590, partial [Bacteroidales bacterium]|nr:hypothetical protein [Bacteroidales bacterium]
MKKYIMKPKVDASEFVPKLLMTLLFFALTVLSAWLVKISIVLFVIVFVLMTRGLCIFYRSLMFDKYGSEELTITQQRLVIRKKVPLLRNTIIEVPMEDILSVETTKYREKDTNGLLLNTVRLLRYFASVVSFNRGHIEVETIYKPYRICCDESQRDEVL